MQSGEDGCGGKKKGYLTANNYWLDAVLSIKFIVIFVVANWID